MRRIALTLALMAAVSTLLACSLVTPLNHIVRMGGELVLIVWNPETKTQHFVRTVQFESKDPCDFGFLIPTPTEPELAEADFHAFYIAEEALRRRPPSSEGVKAAGGARSAVHVLKAQQVGRLDAV